MLLFQSVNIVSVEKLVFSRRDAVAHLGLFSAGIILSPLHLADPFFFKCGPGLSQTADPAGC